MEVKAHKKNKQQKKRISSEQKLNPLKKGEAKL